ncbi:type I restriction-modification system subunit M [Mycoplasma leonicaptivi]|uniref:type I restriction-modification system subunit M n=1 Tax=Mycoplasma leonicaptivi TaxID=36742 RepID=UPI000686AE42|nr:type I restriction-modification system subunit M [Mycoplasma leonicaptivi]
MAKKENNSLNNNKKISKQELAGKIWDSANQLRGGIDSYEYKNYILGLIFYKFLSQKQIEEMKRFEIDEEDFKYFDTNVKWDEVDFDNTGLRNKEQVLQYINEIKTQYCGYFIPYRYLYQTWTSDEFKKNNTFNVSMLSEAVIEFNRSLAQDRRELYEGIFFSFENELSKLGSTPSEQTKRLVKLMDVIDDIPINKQSYDVLGYIYEFLISKFASSAGKTAGEFYTPHEISVLMAQIVAHHLKDKDKIKVYDPTSGSGSLLLTIGEAFKKYNHGSSPVTYYAQELNPVTFNITRMNLIMNNISPIDINVRCGDTLKQDWPFFKDNDLTTYQFTSVDAVVSNPPYSQHWDPTNQLTDPRYAEYGLAPKTKADYAFLLHDLYHLNSNGIMTIVLPHGVLFRGSSEKNIRKMLIEKGQIEAIIGLPANVFYGTNIATIIMVIKKRRDNSNIQFIDASKLFIKDGKQNRLEASHIKRIVDAVNNKTEINGFSKIVSLDEIRNNDYNLNISRYIDNFAKPESYDLYSTMFGGISVKEVSQYNEFWNVFPEVKQSLLKEKKHNYFEILSSQDEQIRNTVLQNSQVLAYFETFKNVAQQIRKFIQTNFKSINQIAQTSVTKFNDLLCDLVFNQIPDLALIDKYDLYQIVVNNIEKLNNDVELITNYKKNDENNISMQEILEKELSVTLDKKGQPTNWESHLISKELITNFFFKDNLNKITTLNDAVEEKESYINDVFENIDEEHKSLSIFSENGFDKKELEKFVKELKKSKAKFDQESIEQKSILVLQAYTNIADLKKEVKEIELRTTSESLAKYNNLTESEFIDLLIEKWSHDIVENISRKSTEIIEEYVAKIETLSDKYKDTFNSINKNIKEQEIDLAKMFSELKTFEESDLLGLQELISIFNK